MIACKLPAELDVPAKARRKKAKRKPARESVIIGNIRYPMARDPRTKLWFIRKRTREQTITITTGVDNVEVAKDIAREKLGAKYESSQKKMDGRMTLQDLVDIYLTLPKRAEEATAEANILRLKRIVSVAWGKVLADVQARDLSPQLWEDYAAKRQGGQLNLATRTEANRGINSAIRMAVSIFTPKLALAYESPSLFTAPDALPSHGLHYCALRGISAPAVLCWLVKDKQPLQKWRTPSR